MGTRMAMWLKPWEFAGALGLFFGLGLTAQMQNMQKFFGC